MRLLWVLMIFLTTNRMSAQDSVHIHGRVADELGRPVANAYVLASEYYATWYDWVGPRKDTFYTDKQGRFSVDCRRKQLVHSALYFKKEGFRSKRHVIRKLNSDTSLLIMVDTAVILRSRTSVWYDARDIEKKDLGMTVGQAVEKYHVDVNESWCHPPFAGASIRGLMTELGDSSEIILFVEPYVDSSANRKMALLDKVVIGVGIANTAGTRRYLGKGHYWKRDINNFHYLERRQLKADK